MPKVFAMMSQLSRVLKGIDENRCPWPGLVSLALQGYPALVQLNSEARRDKFYRKAGHIFENSARVLLSRDSFLFQESPPPALSMFVWPSEIFL